MPLSVGRERSLEAIEAAAASEDKTLFVVAQKDAPVEDPAFEHLYYRRHRGRHQAAGAGRRRDPDDRAGHAPAWKSSKPARPRPICKPGCAALPEPDDRGTEVDALQRTMVDLAGPHPGHVAARGPVGHRADSLAVQGSAAQAYLLASMLSLDLEKEQQLLEATTRLDGAAVDARVSDARSADRRAAAKDRQPGPNRDEPRAARVSSAPADARPSSRSWAKPAANRPKWPSCASAWKKPICPTTCAKKPSASWAGWSGCPPPPPTIRSRAPTST